MPVETTPTATDRLAEVRKLNIEINGLKSAKDTADRAFVEARAAADEALNRKTILDKDIAVLEQGMAGMALEIREFVAHCKEMLQSVVTTMEEAAHQAKIIAGKVDDMIVEISKLEESKKTLLEAISRESELMSQQRADLDIYHHRIIAAAEVHLPGQKIII